LDSEDPDTQTEVKIPDSLRKKFPTFSEADLRRIAMISLLATTNACSLNPSVFTANPTCISGAIGMVDTCSTTFDVQFNLPYLQSQSCFSIQTTDGDILGQLEVTYSGHLVQAVTNFMYYTSDWEGVLETVYNCPYVGGCPDDCDSAINTINAAGHINSKTQYCPGYSYCQRTSACWGNGCFFCDDGCTYGKWAISPLGPVYSANQITNYYDTYQIKAKFIANNGTNLVTNFEQDFTIDSLSVKTYSGFSFNLIGAFNTPLSVNLENYAVLKDDNGVPTAVGSFATKNSPQVRVIGDIQANFSSQLTGCSLTLMSQNVLVASDIAAISTPTSVGFTTPGIQLSKKLPTIINNQLWDSYENDVMASEFTSGPPLLLQWSTDLPITVVKISKITCPAIKILNTTGCYDCDIGFQVFFSVASTCLPGVVIVSSPLCSESTYSVTLEPITGFLYCSTSKQSNVITLSATSGTESGADSFVYELDYIPELASSQLDAPEKSTVASQTGTFLSTEFLDGILGVPFGLTRPVNVFLNILIYIVIAIIGAILIKFAYGCVKKGYQPIPTKETPYTPNSVLNKFQTVLGTA